MLTHCNAGALATAGYGTALGVIRAAVEAGQAVAVFADETRPFLQGARLTAWELVRDGIDTTVITDSMAGPLMRAGRIDLVVVGADRIAANGDTANKIGTYTVAVLAREHKIPFYVAAPLSTIDLATPTASASRSRSATQREVTHLGSSQLDTRGAHIRNPAFDVTPHRSSPASSPSGASSRPPYSETLKQRASQAPTSHSVMTCFAIETSCDETAAAVVAETGDAARPWKIRSNIVASQAAIHREWGGVVPELASRQHVRDICGVVDAALDDARCALARSTPSPSRRGRAWSARCWSASSFAKALAWARGMPVIPRPPPRRPHRIALARPRRAAAAGGGAGRLRRAHQPLSGPSAPASTSSSAARATTRRGRRTTRWRSCWGSAIRAAR